MQVLAHNILAQYTNRQLNINSDKKGKSSEKLASGYQINRSADDAAHLQISEKMRRQIRGLNQASENTQDGISLCQVADGALQETTEILQRINKLTIQAANETNAQTERQAIQDEVTKLLMELNRISETTEFNETVYPLKGGEWYYDIRLPVDSQPAPAPGPGPALEPAPAPKPVDPVVPPLKDSDYGGSSVTVIDSNSIQKYICNPDTNGIKHYWLSEGTYQIDSSITDVIFELSSGNTYLQDTNIKNVGFRCAEGTKLSLKNVTIDDTAGNVSEKAPAIKFTGKGNELNCFGSNTISGGKYIFSVYVDSSVHLEVNGTETSTLDFKGENINTFKRGGIGSLGMPYVGNVTINSGHIGLDTGSSIITGSLVVNGGMIEAESDGGRSAIYGATLIEINGGTINSVGHTPLAAIQAQGTLNINGGYVYAYQRGVSGGGYAIGCNSGDGTADINIKGGTVFAMAESKNTIGIGTNGGSVTISGGTVVSQSAAPNPAIKCGKFTDGVANNPNGKNDGNGHNIYTYPPSSSSSSNPKPVQPDSPSETLPGFVKIHNRAPEGLYIQSTNMTNKGIYIPLVDASTFGLGIDGINVLTAQKATASIDLVAKGLATVSQYRSHFGAYQNRLESAQAVVNNTAENTQSAESVMRDTDMAAELIEYTRHSLLNQSAQSMLAQANQTPQGVLSLLQ